MSAVKSSIGCGGCKESRIDNGAKMAGVIGLVPRDGETASKSKEENYFGCIRVGDGNNLIKPSLIGKVGGAFRDNDSIEQNL